MLLQALPRYKSYPCTYPNTIPLRHQPRWNLSEESNIAQLFAVSAGPEETIVEASNDLADFKTIEPQFDEPVDDEEYKAETAELLIQVPSEYHDFLDVFRRKAGTETLPPPRDFDMKIALIPEARLMTAKLYQLTGEQSKILLDTLQRELAAGRIRPSNAAYGSPTFFVPKKDGRQRMVVDYRHLNSNTIPDVYPLPLVDQFLGELKGSTVFTKLDLVGAYQLLRVSEGYEHLTAFRTQYGMYESLVVRDGLRNAPAVFQHFLNGVLVEVIGRGVIVYIDDILIHHATTEGLLQLTRRVLELLRKAHLYLKATKCEFERTSLTFLGYVISGKGVETDPSKVKAVNDFPRPQDLRQTRGFLGLAGYYRRFVNNYSAIAAPLTALTKSNVLFVWDTAQETAFQTLKTKLTEAPVLAHYDSSAETILQTDASHFGWGFVLSQVDKTTGFEHPIAIESGRFTGAQLNYTTTEKEFLAIVEAFVRRRHMLLQVSTTVVTDHQNLKYWMTPRQLSPRQARWVEILAVFRFKIVYRPGKQASMPDALSRRSDYHPGKGATSTLEQNFAQALPDFGEINAGNRIEDLRALQNSQPIEETELIGTKDIQDGLRDDPETQDLYTMTTSLRCKECNHPECSSHGYDYGFLESIRQHFRLSSQGSPKWNHRGLITINDRVLIPNVADVRLKILRSRHDSALAGHPGVAKTLELISRNYLWKGLKRDVEIYVAGCAVCQRTKLNTQGEHGHLRTLEVPERPWQHITMDFIEKLPESNGYDSILVVVDRLTKWAIFISTKTTLTSSQLAELLVEQVFTQHGLPESIVSDRGSKFVSKFWRYVTSRLNIGLRLSTAYHPQTDGQTERVNQILEQYLRVFTSYNQDDWSSLLSQASFAYNNSLHSSTKYTPFYANFGYNPRWAEELAAEPNYDIPAAQQVASSLLEVHRECTANIVESNRRYARHYDEHRRPTPTFNPGDQVLLNLKNFRTLRPSKKLDLRSAGPYTVIEAIGSHAYRLNLPASRVHNVFHVGLLRLFKPAKFPGQTSTEPGPVTIDDEGEAEYEVANVINSRNNPKTGMLEYLVEWLGYEGTDEHTSWEPKSHLNSAEKKVADFHLRYPEKPSTNVRRKRLHRAKRL